MTRHVATNIAATVDKLKYLCNLKTVKISQSILLEMRDPWALQKMFCTYIRSFIKFYSPKEAECRILHNCKPSRMNARLHKQKFGMREWLVDDENMYNNERSIHFKMEYGILFSDDDF